jgi:hypothetical protein
MAVEVLHRWEAKVAAERQVEQERDEGRSSGKESRPIES